MHLKQAGLALARSDQLGGNSMTTRTRNRTPHESGTGSKSGSRSSESRGIFNWGDNTGPLIGAAIAGAAIGIAANFGRKLMTQAMSGISGDWDEVLATEHEKTLAIFDKMLATDETETWKRTMLLKQLTHALDKHAHQEEMVIYPALREAGQVAEADELNGEHGYVKTYLFDLSRMSDDDENWTTTVREFRGLVAEHAQMEEEQVFPALKGALDEESNDELTAEMNRDGFWQA
jgi:hemerythrin superfamily protein